MKKELTYRKPFYYAGNDEQPYCPRCYEDNGEAFHLTGPALTGGDRKPFYTCPNCSTAFLADGSRSFKMK